jgi:hypothetical protein
VLVAPRAGPVRRRCVEVIVSAFIDRALPPPRAPAQESSRSARIAWSSRSGKVVEAAGVSTLVLNHIVEVHADRARLFQAA